MSKSGQDDAATSPLHQAPDTPPTRRTPGQVLKDIVLLFAAPFITLAYMPLFAFIGLAMLLRKDSRAWHYWHTTE
ncbi:MAG TPA: hypothetical protein VGG00_04250 [Rhodanobacter sp.]